MNNEIMNCKKYTLIMKCGFLINFSFNENDTRDI